MSRKSWCALLAVAFLAVAGSDGALAAEAAAEPKAAEATAAEVKYFPLVPKVEWSELNWLQKTTASIAIVPGCVLSALANTCLWCAHGLSK